MTSVGRARVLRLGWARSMERVVVPNGVVRVEAGVSLGTDVDGGSGGPVDLVQHRAVPRGRPHEQ